MVLATKIVLITGAETRPCKTEACVHAQRKQQQLQLLQARVAELPCSSLLAVGLRERKNTTEQQARVQFLLEKRRYWRDTRTCGAIMLPRQRLVIATSPKSGSTTMRWAMLRLIGNLNTSSICQHEDRLSLYRMVASVTLGRKSDMWGPGTPWGDALLVKYAPPNLVRAAFLTAEWSTIAVVRNPWNRAISSFKHQILLKHVNYNPNSRDDFLKFTLAKEGHGHHSGNAHDFGGIDIVRYDDVVDIDDLANSFAPVFRAVPRLRAPLETGWENCTRDGSQSLLNASRRKGVETHEHYISTDESPVAKRTREDTQHCNESTSRAVAWRYQSDYDLFACMMGRRYPIACGVQNASASRPQVA
mmetsp:Transcript_52555/g.87200  ORF Transcript_52555/g.87200 Transcript_52555/m.87200 type:complete len:360 (-) Transcript_52555:209-1288(-)|eukprot:CAMPEP_0119317458 /NCGR_PEP_ID=MMETSP1333-20130426/43196_1 /TAXON_ID=418940 /ORGANISM="Scyphosphaera apsteinii, Strain RCC1455" /LENGTH=359 /DNA_ID=CAMNT_0007323393 /DNA_START=71 /DNA_END=1150 /DNA_ORIENTATION=+